MKYFYNDDDLEPFDDWNVGEKSLPELEDNWRVL